MRKTIAAGETVLDIIFKNNLVEKAVSGGSMLNSAISLGRLNIPVHFVTELGDDMAGKLIMRFLQENNVNIDSVYIYKDGKTILAMAFLDENNNAEYDFYKLYPSRRFEINLPEMVKDDIFLFGSFFSIDSQIRDKVFYFVSQLKRNDVIIIYDPNFRKPHIRELNNLLPFIRENIGFSHIVKGSDEDFELIFGLNDCDEIYELISSLGCKNLIITGGNKDVIVMTDNFKKYYKVRKIENIKSTIGAGDNFNSGILYSLFAYNIKLDELNDLSEKIWDRIIDNSILFASCVCESYENYISSDVAAAFLNRERL